MTTITNISAVDDDRDILEIIEHEFINDREYKFKFFTDGNAFLEGLSEDVDLVVLDIHLGDFDVIRAVEMIDQVSPMAYIIIISAQKDFSQLVKLTNMGIFRFCEKDGMDFLPDLRAYIKAAHWKISKRKSVIEKFLSGRSQDNEQ